MKLGFTITALIAFLSLIVGIALLQIGYVTAGLVAMGVTIVTGLVAYVITPLNIEDDGYGY